MSDIIAFRSYADIAERLPFHLDDTDKVNHAFAQWQRDADPDAAYIVDLWTYCFVRRYFLVKQVVGALNSGPADLDALVEQVYRRIYESRDQVGDGKRYAQWVSVICKNAFLNTFRSRTILVSIDEEDSPALAEDPPDVLYDPVLVHESVRQAIDRLPGYLQQVARLRFIQDCSYLEMEQLTGKAPPTIRSYVNKALAKLRKDKHLLDFLNQSGEDLTT